MFHQFESFINYNFMIVKIGTVLMLVYCPLFLIPVSFGVNVNHLILTDVEQTYTQLKLIKRESLESFYKYKYDN